MADVSAYDTARLRFLTLWTQVQNNPISIHNPATMTNVMHQIKKYKIHDTPYEVLHTSLGSPFLILKRKSPNDKIVKVLPVEEIFQVLYSLHLQNDHKSMDLRPYLEDYLIPDIFLYLLVQSCIQCYGKYDEPPEVQSGNVGLVYVVPGYKTNQNTVEKFEYMLIYIHKETYFTILRPLEQKDAFEIAIELMKIVTQFGLPQKILLHGYSNPLGDQIINNFKGLCPNFNIIFECKGVDYSGPANIVNKLISMCNKNKDTSWDLQLPYLQKSINMEINKTGSEKYAACKKSPFQKLFSDLIKDNYRICQPYTTEIDDDLNESVPETIQSPESSEDVDDESVNITDDIFEIEENTIADDDFEETKELLKEIGDNELIQTSNSIQNTNIVETNEELTKNNEIRQKQDSQNVDMIETISLDDKDKVMDQIQFSEQQIGKIEEIMNNITIDGSNEDILEIIAVKQEAKYEAIDTDGNVIKIMDQIETKDEQMDPNIEITDITSSDENMEEMVHTEIKIENVQTVTEVLDIDTILNQEKFNQENPSTSETKIKGINKTEEDQEQKKIKHEVEEDDKIVDKELIVQELIDNIDDKIKLLEELDKVSEDEGEKDIVQTDYEVVLDGENFKNSLD